MNNAQRMKVLNDALTYLLVLRLLGVALLFCTGILVLRPSFRSHETSTRVILTGIYGLIFLLLGIIAVTPAPYNYMQHFTGLYLALFFQFSFFYLRSKYALTVAIVTFAALILLQLTLKVLNPTDFAAGLFYLFNMTIVVMACACTPKEFHANGFPPNARLRRSITRFR